MAEEELVSPRLEGNVPNIEEPSKTDDPLRPAFKLGGLTFLDLRNLLASINALIFTVAGLEWARKAYPSAFWAAIVLASLCLVNVVWHTVVLIRRRQHAADLRRWAIWPLSEFQPGYFQVGPYTSSEADRKRYTSPSTYSTSMVMAKAAACGRILKVSAMRWSS